MMRNNILEVCLSPNLGGLELFMLSCIEHFSKQSNVFHVVGASKKLNDYLDKKNGLNLKRNKFFPIIPALKLASYIDEKSIDIIHFHWTKDMLLVVLAKVLSNRKPKVVQSRHMTMTRFKDDFYHKWLYKNIDTLHAVTFQVKEQLEKFIPLAIRPKIEVVHPGTIIPSINKIRVDELRKKYALEESFVIGIIGRIEDAKGQFLVLEAVSKLKGLNIKALIVGQAMDDDYLKMLKKRTIKLGIEEKIIFTGFTKEINEHISLCDVTILATEKETFGLIVIESMANGVPVIATKRGGPLEIIEEGVDGLFFNRTSEALATEIKRIYNNPDLIKEIKRKAFITVSKKFDSRIQLEKLFKLIDEK